MAIGETRYLFHLKSPAHLKMAFIPLESHGFAVYAKADFYFSKCANNLYFLAVISGIILSD